MKIITRDKELSARFMKDPLALKQLLNPVRWRILKKLAEKPSYPAEIAKDLKLDEQKVYYHINQLKKSGVISVAKTEEMHGATARYFQVRDKAFAIVLKEDWKHSSSKAVDIPSFLSDFYDDGFNATIIVGSPDPHGPHQARARDTHYLSDLCLFLGSLSTATKPSVKLDTEVRERELEENNLILIGGPITNMITARINDELPIKMKTGERWSIYSENTGKTYYENPGLIIKIKNHQEQYGKENTHFLNIILLDLVMKTLNF